MREQNEAPAYTEATVVVFMISKSCQPSKVVWPGQILRLADTVS